MIPLIDPDVVIKGRGAIKVNIQLMDLDEIGKNISLAVTKHVKKQTTERTKQRSKTSERKGHRDRTSNTNHDWLIFRTTLAPNIRLTEHFIYDETGILSVSSGFVGDKRRINLPVIEID